MLCLTIKPNGEQVLLRDKRTGEAVAIVRLLKIRPDGQITLGFEADQQIQINRIPPSQPKSKDAA